MVSTVTRELSPAVTNVGPTSPEEKSVTTKSKSGRESVISSRDSGEMGQGKRRHYCRHYVLPLIILVLIVVVIILFFRLHDVKKKRMADWIKKGEQAATRSSNGTTGRDGKDPHTPFLYGTLTVSILLIVLIIVIRPHQVLRKIKVKKRRRDNASRDSSEDVTTARYTDVKDLCRSLPSIPQGDHGRVDDNSLESEKCVENPLYSCPKQAAEAVGIDGEKIDGAVHVDDEKRRGNCNVVVATLHQSPSNTPPPLIVDHLYETVQEALQCKPEDDASVSRSRHESEPDPGTTSPYDRLNRGFVLPDTGQEKPPQPALEDGRNDKVSDGLPGKPTLEDSDRQSEIHVYSNYTEEEKPLEATDRQSEIHVYSNYTDEGKPLEATDRQSEIHVYSNYTDEGKPMEATDRQSQIHVYSNYTDEGKPLEATETSANPAYTDK